MPLVGILYRDHPDTPLRGLTWDEAIAKASEGGLPPYPASLIRALRHQQREDATPSASSVTGCLRRFELQRQVPYYRTVESMLPAFFGTAVHALIDGAPKPPWYTGERNLTLTFEFPDLPTPYNRVVFSGTCDERDSHLRVTNDWKTKRFLSPAMELDEAHGLQASIYNMLAVASGEESYERVVITYMDQGTVVQKEVEVQDPRQVWYAVRDILYAWARCKAQGILPEPLQGFLEIDPKTKRGAPKPGPAQCYWCDVRPACLEAWDRDNGLMVQDDLGD